MMNRTGLATFTAITELKQLIVREEEVVEGYLNYDD